MYTDIGQTSIALFAVGLRQLRYGTWGSPNTTRRPASPEEQPSQKL